MISDVKECMPLEEDKMLFGIGEIIEYYLNKTKKIKFSIILIFIFSLFSFILFYKFFPNQEYLLILSISGIFLIILLSIILLTIKCEWNKLNNSSRLLNNNNKDELEKIILYCKGEYLLTENNIFLFSNPINIDYDNILLIYKKHNIYRYFSGESDASSLSDFLVSNQSIIIITKDKKAIRLRNDSRRFLFFDDIKGKNSRFFYSVDKNIENIIKNKNPNILIGNTEENKRILKEKYGMDLECLKYFG